MKAQLCGLWSKRRSDNEGRSVCIQYSMNVNCIYMHAYTLHIQKAYNQITKKEWKRYYIRKEKEENRKHINK